MPENTIAAFRKALEMGAGGIECDVRISSDGYPVIIHDDTIDRTTSGCGKVRQFNAAQLVQYGIPVLWEVLKLLREEKILLFLEIKETGYEREIITTVGRSGIADRVIYISFSEESLAKTREIGDKLQTGFLYSGDGFPEKILEELGVKYFLPEGSLVTKDVISAAHSKGLEVFTWTIDDRKTAERLIECGVDGIITNKPDLLCESGSW